MEKNAILEIIKKHEITLEEIINGENYEDAINEMKEKWNKHCENNILD